MVTILRELFTFSGRLNRKKFILYWVFASAFQLLIIILFYFLEKIIILSQTLVGGIIVISMLVGAIAHICLAVRRLHDIGCHGAMVIALFIPIINVILYFYLIFIKGTKGYNYYGPDPLEEVE